MTWTLDLCHDWQRIGLTTAFKFDGVVRDKEPGAWSASSSEIEWGTYVDGLDTVTYNYADVDTVRLVENGVIRYAGWVLPSSEGFRGATKTSSLEGVRYEWSGIDLWLPLASRVAFPDPANFAGSWTTSHDVRSGVASAALAGYLNANAGTTALEYRQFPNFVVEDTEGGPSGTWSARLQPLTELVRRICGTTLTCRMEMDFDGVVHALIHPIRDRSNSFMFSDQGDLKNIIVSRKPAGTTYAIAGGQGEGVDRTFAYYGDGSTGAALREAFLDHSSLAELDELGAEAILHIAEQAEAVSVSAELSDEVAAWFYTRCNVGDLVAVIVDRERHAVPVTSIKFEISAERQTVRPVLGVAARDGLAGLSRRVARLTAEKQRTIA